MNYFRLIQNAPHGASEINRGHTLKERRTEVACFCSISCSFNWLVCFVWLSFMTSKITQCYFIITRWIIHYINYKLFVHPDLPPGYFPAGASVQRYVRAAALSWLARQSHVSVMLCCNHYPPYSVWVSALPSNSSFTPWRASRWTETCWFVSSNEGPSPETLATVALPKLLVVRASLLVDVILNSSVCGLLPYFYRPLTDHLPFRYRPHTNRSTSLPLDIFRDIPVWFRSSPTASLSAALVIP